MRRFIALVAVLGLTACGGEMLPEEGQAIPAQEAAQVAEPVASEVSSDALCTTNPWECFCGQFKTEAKCRPVSSCVWAFGRCSPTYE